MKYLQIYEAFESNVISKAIKFLKGKNINTKKFKSNLVDLQNKIDYPLSSIDDKDVKYLKFSKAVELKNDKDIDNKWGIYCMKYWFSLEKGYLGSTITGNKKLSFGRNRPFIEEHFNYIVDKLGIKTGILKPVKHYLNLKTGDKVIGMYTSGSDRYRIGMGTIVRYGDYIYVIQNVSAGTNPTEDDFDDEGEWKKYGNQGWTIHTDHINNDHHNLHLYIDSDDKLHYEDDDDNYLSYNLPNSNDLNVYEWDDIFINDSDFAIVIMVDDLLKKNVPEKSAISDERNLRKRGALKLMSDEMIRDFNINKYLNIQISKLINKDTAEFYDLQKMVSKIYCGKYILPALLGLGGSNRDNVDTLIDILKNIAANVGRDNNTNIKNAINLYKHIIKHNNAYSEKFKNVLEFAKESIKNDDIKIIIDMIERMSNKIYNHLEKQNIQTIEDLRIIFAKLNNIYYFFKSDDFNVNQVDEIIFLITRLYLPEAIQDNIRYFNTDKSYKKTIESIKIIEKHINSDFK